MKKTIFLFSLILGLGVLFSPAFGQLDRMIQRTKDKTKQKVQKRVERKVDNAVDKTLDEAENTVDGKTKKKKDKKDKKKDKKDKKNKGGDDDDDDDSSSGGSNTSNKSNTSGNSGSNSNSGTNSSNNNSGNSGNSGTYSPNNSNSGSNTSGKTNSGSNNTGGSVTETKSAPTNNSAPANNTSTAAASDFYPGDYLLFTDDLFGEEIGEFPSKWNLLGGSAENRQFGQISVIAFTGTDSEITPLLKSEEFLPVTFTIEFDAYFYSNTNNDAYFLKMAGLKPIRIVRNSAEMGRFNGFAKDNGSRAAWRKVSLSYNEGALKLYLDNDRVLNIPKISPAPTSFSIAAVSPGARTGEPAMVRDIRVAMGGQELYEYFLSAGKIVTRSIEFQDGQTELKPQAKKYLDEIATIMKDHKDTRFSIDCHTDSKGNDALNKSLSEQRARVIKAELEKRGVASNRLEVRGFGESKPVDTNRTTEGRMNNNRVEFVQL